jgi:hypothetical protein
MSIVSDLPDMLTDVRRPGDFFSHGIFEWRAPSLSVAGVGPISLPLLEEQAKRLIGVAELAPYGRREETIVDAAVRNSWQIDASLVEIAGARWAEALDGVVARATEGLGVEGAVEAIFYKLLIYEPGGFFLGHRDTEKCPGMFATLIVAPPGLHTGGELVVRHRDREARLDLKSTDPAEASFAAFYADCPHEVRPVETGHRLVMVYNLKRKGKGEAPEPPNYDQQAQRISGLFERWRVAEGAPEKIVFPLEHAYTCAALSFAALKGADQAVAKTLRAAAGQAGFGIHLALLTVEESGSAEYSDSYSRRGRWGEEEDAFEVGEVIEHDARLGAWKNAEDENCDFPALTVADAELSPPGVFDDLEPDEEYFGEATGNEGASFERTYRRAAIVLWPSEALLSVLAGADIPDALDYLESRIERARSDDDRVRAKALADAIAKRLAGSAWFSYSSNQPTPAARLLEALRRLDHVAGIEGVVERVLPARGFEAREATLVIAALSLVEDSRRASLVERLVAGAAPNSFAACAKLLRRLAETADANRLRTAAAHLLAAMPPRPDDEPSWRTPRPDPEEIADLLATLQRIDEDGAWRAVERLLATPKTFGFDEILVPALRLLAEQGELAAPGVAVEKLRSAALAHLRARAAEPLTPPADWRRQSTLGCRCRDCTDFSRFLDDPAQKVFVLRAAESARAHLQQTFNSARSDVDSKTERKGRPYSLICTKNQASYDRRVTQRREDLEHVSILGN